MTDQHKPALEFIRYTLEQLCAHKDSIVISPEEENDETIFYVTAHPEDMGRVIGKEGQTITALRNLIKVMGARQSERYYLKTRESEAV